MMELSATVYGRVHGIFFRASTQDTARALGLVGYVKNNPDGTVCIVAQGEKSALRELLQFALAGPPGAVIERVDEMWKEIVGPEFDEFEISYT